MFRSIIPQYLLECNDGMAEETGERRPETRKVNL